MEPSKDFDFSKLNLENPIPLQGGNFFTKLNFSEKQLPLIIQLPKCTCKHGIIKTQSKKSYTDLLFNYFETDLITWFENLEQTCMNLIHSKKDIWFQTEMDLDDIETMFISPTKTFKAGKFTTLRTYIPYTKQIKREYCLIYDENERTLETSAITDKTKFIPLITIEGIKFSSKSFQVEINLRQIMVLSIEDEIQKCCLIKNNKQEPLDKEDKEDKEDTEDKEDKEDTEDKEEPPILLSNIVKITPQLVVKQKEKDVKTHYDIQNNDKQNNNNELVLEETTKIKNKQVLEEKKSIKDDLIEKDGLIDLLEEVDILVNDDGDNVSLKNPKDVYQEIYKTAKQKALHMKKAALEAYLEVRNIKTKYMLDEINTSDEDFNNSEFEE